MLRRHILASGRRIAAVSLVNLIILCIALPDTADARRRSKHRYNPPYAAIVIDANTDAVLYSRSADAARYPASLTKMMTLYLLFDAIDAGKVSESTQLKMSAHAASQPPSKLALKPGQTISVRNAILALVTKSANDVAVAVSEHLASSEAEFARRMTAKARQLGMSNTTFMNASGLPNNRQVTTARDMATLAEALIRDHPKHYRYFSTRYFSYKGRRYRNHNRLLGRVRGVDGVKTGYIHASGFNLTTSARRGGKHLIAVVMGGRSGRARDANMAHLLARYFRKASARKPLAARLAGNVPLPPVRPMSVSYSDMPANPPKAQLAADTPQPAPSVEVMRAGSVSLHSAKQVTIPGQQLTILTPTAMPAPMAPGAAVTDEIAKRITDHWLIQIGAYNDEPAAKEKLMQAREAINALGQRLAYTEPVQKNDSTLWRARFAGFDKQSAKRTCVRLKRANFNCLAMRQESAFGAN